MAALNTNLITLRGDDIGKLYLCAGCCPWRKGQRYPDGLVAFDIGSDDTEGKCDNCGRQDRLSKVWFTRQ